VSVRTLRKWQHGEPKACGRPVHPRALRWQVLWLVARELRRQGRQAGWRPVSDALGHAAPVRLVQYFTARLKARHDARVRRRREALRQHIEVQHADALWSIDGTQAGRVHGTPVRAEVVRNVGARCTTAIGVSTSITGALVVDLLTQAAKTDAAMPLVIASDNGSENRNEDMERFLEEHRIIPLWSLPRTPQHNAWAERGIRELKADAELDSSSAVSSVTEVAMRLGRSWRRLDHERSRPRSPPTPSPDRRDRNGVSQYTREHRERFYRTAQAAIADAERGCQGKREKARARREAILVTLEQFGVIRRTWGSGATTRVKRERIA
jgi:transposase InsO family protein